MNDFQENYSYLKYKKYSISQIIQQFEKDFKKTNNDENFIKLLIKVLSLFEDPHISLIDKKEQKYYNTYNFNLIQNFNYKLLFEKYFKNNFIIMNLKIEFI